jgi:hypothetical protein
MMILYLSERGANDIVGATHCLSLEQTNPFSSAQSAVIAQKLIVES